MNRKNQWNRLSEAWRSGYHDLKNFLSKTPHYPDKNSIFKAFKSLSPEDVKVVILGQDPYHNGSADGLAFSVKDNYTYPPSLKNIFKELKDDIGIIPSTGSLKSWANEGVLLLNSLLTVSPGIAGSHRGKGWEEFTDMAIQILLEGTPKVFILWGNYAQSKCYFINKPHMVISSPHPSPFSASKGFFGSKPFSKANKFLKTYSKEITWRLDEGRG